MKSVRQRKINTVWCHLNVENKKGNKLVNITKQKQTHSYREQASGYKWRDASREGQHRGRRLRVETIMYKISYKNILYYTENIANVL